MNQCAFQREVNNISTVPVIPLFDWNKDLGMLYFLIKALTLSFFSHLFALFYHLFLHSTWFAETNSLWFIRNSFKSYSPEKAFREIDTSENKP